MTGRMFSLIFSRRCGSAEPKTMRWTLLYILRHVLKECELGSAARSCKYVWKSQKVYTHGLATTILTPACRAHQQRPVHRLLAQVYYEFLQRHGLIVHADEEVA